MKGTMEAFVAQTTPAVGLFPPEQGRLHIEGTRFFTERGEVWQYRGYSLFTNYYDFLYGKNIRPDLRILRKAGFNVIRVFGPLDWDMFNGTYMPEQWDPSGLSEYFHTVGQEGMRVEFVPICIPFDFNLQRLITQDVFLYSQWNVLVEVCNEPRRKIDGQIKCVPADVLRGLDRRGVLCALGDYPQPGERYSTIPRADYGTIHIYRNDVWDRGVKTAYEVQEVTGIPWVSDEPTRAVEEDEGSQTTDSVAEYSHHGGIACLFTPGFTYHCNEGKFGRVPNPDQTPVQKQIMDGLTNNVFREISPEWQFGRYTSPDSSRSPVNWTPGIWTYSSILNDSQAISIRVDDHPSEPEDDWQEIERWGPHDTFMRLQKK